MEKEEQRSERACAKAISEGYEVCDDAVMPWQPISIRKTTEADILWKREPQCLHILGKSTVFP